MPTVDELRWLDATATAELVRRGELSSREVVEAAIARIERLNPALNAVIAPTYEAARAALDRLPAAAPLRGVPFLLKDLTVEQAGLPYWMGNRALRERDHRSASDTVLGARFRAAGLVTLGKTNTPEFGPQPTTQPLACGPTHNPWQLAHSAGGSSGGSCAAVAAGLVPIAHANDGGGSIRLPASWCGLVGLKPSRGRTAARAGEVNRNVVEHVVSRSVRDTALALDCVHGAAPGELYVAPPPARRFAAEVGAPPPPLRIGLLTRAPHAETHAECVAAAERAAHRLASLGHQIEPAWPQALFDADVPERTAALWAVGSAVDVDNLAERLGRAITADDVEPYTWAMAAYARRFSGAEIIRAMEVQQRYAERVAQWWSSGFDLLLTPTTTEPPPRLEELVPAADRPLRIGRRFAAISAFTIPFNVTGQPAISLPLHWSADGLPVGVQLVAAYGREDLLLRVAAQLEDWETKHPA
ncbi:MAG: amidase [Deltaproteobacteria bacterium]|nr:amidase [Deltaproteobacteria bacterium]